jgi:hypothetical protein
MPAFYPEGDEPKLADPSGRSLHKINSLLKSIDTKTGTGGSGDALTDAELRATPVPVIASQSTASDLKTQAQIIDSSGSAVSYAEIGTAGSPSSDVVSVQGVSGGTVIPVSLNGISPSSGRLPVDIGGDGPLPIQGTVTAIPDVVSIAQGIQYQLDHSGPITRPQDVGDGIEYYLENYGNNIPVIEPNSTSINSNTSGIYSDTTAITSTLGSQTDAAATNDTGSFSVMSLIKRGLQNWTSLLAKIPALVSGRIPVDGSGVTQPISASSLPLPSGASTAAKQPALGTAGTPSSDVITVQGASGGTALNTKEIQPIGDYVINVGAAGVLSLSGSAVSTAGFDAGTTADYVAVTIEGGGPSGGFYIDGSVDNTNWTTGQYISVYYDVPTSSLTDAYSYRSVTGQLFGNTRINYYGRFLVSCTQQVPFSSNNVTYRYFRITTPATYGTWRYKFASYKSPTYSVGYSNPGGVTRVNGRVDVGYVANLPTLSATVTQATATSLRAQAEAYQGGTAVGSANPLQVTLANTGANATAVKVDGSAVTQPVSIASAISQKVQGWDIGLHDYRGLAYTSGNLTSVTYKTGGSSGTTVATLTLGYDGSGNLTSVTKS